MAEGDYQVGLDVARLTRAGTETLLHDDAAATFEVTSTEPAPAPDGRPSMLFGVYPGGGNGELGAVQPPPAETVLARLGELSGDQAFDIHLYTAWSWHNDEWLDSEIAQYTAAGYYVTLTIKYSPPAGREGDAQGYADFARRIVGRYAANPLVHQYVVGNEINVVNGNPGSSDGPFAGVREATVAGVLAAAGELDSLNSPARIGISMAVLERETDAQFLRGMTRLGGSPFTSAVSFLGLNVYPGLWPVGTGDPYADMVTHLENARSGLTGARFGGSVSIIVLENGYPTSDEMLQDQKLDAFVRATCDVHESAGVAGYSWFDLWDADSSSDNMFAHYGLLRSDMSHKPAFARYQEFISTGCE